MKFLADLERSNNSGGRRVRITAKNLSDAISKAVKLCDGDNEYAYQVYYDVPDWWPKFHGCSLNQPIWDHMNGKLKAFSELKPLPSAQMKRIEKIGKYWANVFDEYLSKVGALNPPKFISIGVLRQIFKDKS